MKKLALLGSTGSIGVSTLALVREFPERFQIYGMVAGRNLPLLAKQIREFSPVCVAIQRQEDVSKLRALLGRRRVEILHGESGASDVAAAPEVDIVLAAIVGGAGLMPSFNGVLAGKEIALANKEALVMAGELFVGAAKKKRVASTKKKSAAAKPHHPDKPEVGKPQGAKAATSPRTERTAVGSK